MLKLEGIGKSFAGVRVLQDISFEVAAGEVHVLAGENGAGKSTLIKILAGVHSEDEGRILLQGEPVAFGSPKEAMRHGVSVIHQELSLIDSLSVAENLFLGNEQTRRRTWGQWIHRGELNTQALTLCLRVGLDFTLDDVQRPVEEFSLSTKNRLEIAKAIAHRLDVSSQGSRVLILDEPTSALNSQEAERLFDLIGAFKRDGYAIIYISHKMDEIYRLADRISVLRDGRLITTAKASELPQTELVRLMVGRSMSAQFPGRMRPIEPNAPVRLEVRGIPTSQSHKVSFSVRAGEVLGIAGLQGSGNSELLNSIFGARGKLSQGEVILDGQSVVVRSPREAIQQGLALLTSDRKTTGLVLGLGIRENITLASLRNHVSCGWIRTRRERERAWLRGRELSIRCTHIDQEVGTLSGGNQQKVALAKWLEVSPRVLLLDEPTRGVDVGAKHEIYALIRELVDVGHSIVLITSEMAELLALSDRILVMHRGQVTEVLTGESATQERVLAAAMGRQSVELHQRESEVLQ